ncbi:DsbA family oxidoreductase [Tropicimonas sediminicola]|uniref:Predicted dithiol-disulfide isomerase, DsbA family n=1 Tax=Tropicimonas sediminicola TaxID=1031541 RepID=A0A239F409_9RHOB|nr:DsbA family oxidoreductase [Tropicimonas sediminicola]SNS51577.1 Predicted dithiol-disulfide isomerase, DsbA family [Tropicimonas sediminicola]
MTDTSETLRIDIVSDVVCPWCIVGYRQLVRALEATGTKHEIHWHPFELNPQMPPEGQNLREHIAEKYGASPEESERNRQRLAEIGADLGFAFNYTDDMRMPNTFDAHRLLHWADLQGSKHALKQALFAAYFTDRRDISDHEVLADIAAEVGLDRAKALEVLTEQRHASDVRTEQNFWLRQGIRGVPAMVFDRRHLVTGAQGLDGYIDILNQLAQMRAETH